MPEAGRAHLEFPNPNLNPNPYPNAQSWGEHTSSFLTFTLTLNPKARAGRASANTLSGSEVEQLRQSVTGYPSESIIKVTLMMALEDKPENNYVFVTTIHPKFAEIFQIVLKLSPAD